MINRKSWKLWLHVPSTSSKVAALQNLRLDSWLSMCFAAFKYALLNTPGIFSSNPCFCALNKALNNVQVLNGYSEEFRHNAVIQKQSTGIKNSWLWTWLWYWYKSNRLSFLSRLGNKEILSYQTFGCVYKASPTVNFSKATVLFIYCDI